MEKLIKKFEKINSRMLSQHGNAISSAEEAKKLSLAFANYQENSQYDEDKCMPQEALFNKFLDEFYK